MDHIPIDLSTVNGVKFAGFWHGVKAATLKVGNPVFDGETGHLSFFFTDSDGKHCVVAYHQVQAFWHNTPEPEPEPKPEPHKLLPVGTRVLVSDWFRDDFDEVRLANPVAGRISGYDMHRTKYRWQQEFEPGRYATTERWAFADNRVEVHPDGPSCSLPPQPVKQEPTGPRIYVQNLRGKQGYVVDVRRVHDDNVQLKVQWFAPGTRPVWVDQGVLTLITEDDVERCPNGQTADECGSGENQCELCLQAEDAEADTIEESMGLR